MSFLCLGGLKCRGPDGEFSYRWVWTQLFRLLDPVGGLSRILGSGFFFSSWLVQFCLHIQAERKGIRKKEEKNPAECDLSVCLMK